MSITIILADDHPVILQGLRAVLQRHEDISIVAETGDGLKAVQLVNRLKPDVLLLDLMLPGLNGLEVARSVAKSSPRTRVVFLSMYSNDAYVAEAFKVGAWGYVLKGRDSSHVVRAIGEALAGRCYLSPPLNQRALAAYNRKAKSAVPNSYETLTARERQVLQLVVEGHTSVRIAQRLRISPRTVEVHRVNLSRKLGIRTTAALVRYAIRRGLIAIEQ